MRSSIRASRAGGVGFAGAGDGAGASATAVAAAAGREAVFTPTEGLEAMELATRGTESFVPLGAIASSRTAVISHACCLNNPNFGRSLMARVLRMSASLPRSRLMSSRPSCNDLFLYVFTFIVRQLQERQSERSAECHSVKRPQAEA